MRSTAACRSVVGYEGKRGLLFSNCRTDFSCHVDVSQFGNCQLLCDNCHYRPLILSRQPLFVQRTRSADAANWPDPRLRSPLTDYTLHKPLISWLAPPPSRNVCGQHEPALDRPPVTIASAAIPKLVFAQRTATTTQCAVARMKFCRTRASLKRVAPYSEHRWTKCVRMRCTGFSHRFLWGVNTCILHWLLHKHGANGACRMRGRKGREGGDWQRMKGVVEES